MRRERNSVIPTFDYEVDLRQHSSHLCEPGGMMAKIVGAWNRVQQREHRARYEGRSHHRFVG